MTGGIQPAAGVNFDTEVQVLVIGAGACGLVAGLAASDAGGEVLVLERDPRPSGSTALSSGFIPAAPTRFQKKLGIGDSAARFADDIQLKSGGLSIDSIVNCVTQASGPALEWLADSHDLEWIVLADFLYPGHSRHRMHAVPERTGTGLMARLQIATERAGLPIATNARVTSLYVEQDRISGVAITRPDDTVEMIGCRSLILACSGFGGAPRMVSRHIPEMSDALYFGHAGNQGDALRWGSALGAAIEHMSGYQGHGSVAHPEGVLITWALMMEGGIQVNLRGERFANEHDGYSEQAVHVLAQPDGVAWNIYDERLNELGMTFEDYRSARDMGAIRTGADVEELASVTGLPRDRLQATLAKCGALASANRQDEFGRHFRSKRALVPPYCAVKVTGALFHTQGGLLVDGQARVLKRNGKPFPNLLAGGGAACGVSGPNCAGYLSGNGLLTAVSLGRLAGITAVQKSF